MEKKKASPYSVISCQLAIIISILFAYNFSSGQLISNTSTLNTITTAVPFLLIAPDSRAGGMGDAGVASTPDANSQHWNPAKYAFIDNDMGVSVSYSPWLRSLVSDMSLAYISGYKKVAEDQVLSASLRYFSLGSITFTDQNGNDYYTAHPNEMAIDLAYSRKLSPHFSGGIALRFIRSNLTDGISLEGSNGEATHPGYSVAADASIFYTKKFSMGQGQDNAIFALGANISNIGTKITYTSSTERDFIPTNLRLGPSLTMNLDEYNTLSFEIDANKLLVPTPPEYAYNTATGTTVLYKGMNSNVGVVQGIFQSFYDAPGGFTEQLQEISLATGLEYWYEKQFGIRAGFFYENPNKGGREFFTIGVGLKYSVFGLDFAYLIPVDQRNPLENTLTFTLIFNFDVPKNQPVGPNPTKK
jgi:hypothetical protein